MVRGFAEHKRILAISLVVVVTLLFSATPYATHAANLWEIITTPQLMFAWVGSGVLWLMSGILGITAILLNITILQTVTGMGNHINDIIGIQIAWALLRDMANILFIFGIVYIGLNLILGNNRHGHQQALARLVIIALVINFSLFITKTVVETSNVMANTIFRLIIPPGTTGSQACDGRSTLPENVVQCVNFGITGIINNSLGLTTVFNVGGTANSAGFTSPTLNSATAIDASKIFYITALGSIFILITAFVFASAAVLLVIRFVILIILMVFSPLAFAAWILPSTSGYFSYWLKSLLNQSFFAPAYMLMMWIAIKIIEGYGVSTVTGVATRSNNFGAALLGANVSFANVFLNFAIITVFMVAALVVAKKLGAIGADKAYGIGKGWVNTAQSTAYRYKGVIAAGAAGVAAAPIVASYAGLAGTATALGAIPTWVGGKSRFRNIAGGVADKMNSTAKEGVRAGGALDTLREATLGKAAKAKYGTGENIQEYRTRLDKSATEVIKNIRSNPNYSATQKERMIDDYLKRQSPRLKSDTVQNMGSKEFNQRQEFLNRAQPANLANQNDDIRRSREELSLKSGEDREKSIKEFISRNQADLDLVTNYLTGLPKEDLETTYASALSDRMRVAFEEHNRNLQRVNEANEIAAKTSDPLFIARVKSAGNNVHEVLNQLTDTQQKAVEDSVGRGDKPGGERHTWRQLLNEEVREKTEKESATIVGKYTKRRRQENLISEVSKPTPDDARLEKLINDMSPSEVIPLFRRNPNVFNSPHFGRHVTVKQIQKLINDDEVGNDIVEVLAEKALSESNSSIKNWLVDPHNQDARIIKERLIKKGITI